MPPKKATPKLEELRHQLESIFRGFYNGHDVIRVCSGALENQAADQDMVIANVLNSIALVRMDYHLRLFAKLIKSIGGSTAYDDDDEEGWEDGYQEIKAEDRAAEEAEDRMAEEAEDDEDTEVADD